MCFALVMAARTDALKRGFIPCTENLVLQLTDCPRGRLVCPLKSLWQNTKCNTMVVLDGFGAWVKGKQERPWSNYLFEPVLERSDDSQAQAEKIKDEIKTLKKQYEILQKQENEAEVKAIEEYQLNDKILSTTSKEAENLSDNEIAEEKDIEREKNSGDIQDEAFTDAVSENDGQNESIYSKKSTDTLEMLQKFTAEKLQKGSMKNEK